MTPIQDNLPHMDFPDDEKFRQIAIEGLKENFASLIKDGNQESARDLAMAGGSAHWPDDPVMREIFVKTCLFDSQLFLPDEFFSRIARDPSNLSSEEQHHLISYIGKEIAEAAPKVFFSYSHESEAHKDWVRLLASNCRSKGVNAILDQWDLTVGMDVTAFMERGLTTSDFIVVVCSESYVNKANNLKGGVGYERMILTAELIRDLDTTKVIPIIRGGIRISRLPVFLSNRVYLDFSEDNRFDANLDRLLRVLHQNPEHVRPEIGRKPY